MDKKTKLFKEITGAIPKNVRTNKEKYTIPKEFHDEKITEQSKHMMTNKEKLQMFEDMLVRDLEGLSDFIVLERRLKLILLIEQIKDITK